MNHLYQFLIGKTPNQVISHLKSLKVSVSQKTVEQDLYLFNYDDDAPRGQPLVEGCRGVVFQYHSTINNGGNINADDDDNDADDDTIVGSWTCVRSSFDRFYNYGEDHSPRLPAFNEITIQEKKDGTLLMITMYQGTFFIGTRNLFDIEKMLGVSGKNMNNIVKELIEPYVHTIINNPDKTFMFELCTPWNQVVVQHDEPHISLLGIRSNIYPYPEFDPSKFDFGENRPTLPSTFDLDTIAACKDEVERLGGSNFEGFILKFGPIDTPSRIKLKSSTFLNLMHVGQSRTSPEELLISAMIEDDVDEVLAVHPAWKNRIYVAVKCAMDALDTSMKSIHENVLKLKFPDTVIQRKKIAIAAEKSPFIVFHIDNFNIEMSMFDECWKQYKKINKVKIVKYLLSHLI